ncbi:SDR family oxidoreductase [Streptomyces rhizosphaerihabitans]|uniref:SDR family oxidoreductase n=1 Tax=Streptomyces rhizosphaerihabitans TaxID=1266770 RepID=UPI0021C09D29|nr:SDR family oxidoreductase [Streptomyces rhizosphaerihabitans]MCT9010814.1 SDR family oxidoreductase [Streptomyces rhizosphaerihabitans]
MQQQLSGRLALVTGGARNIGRSVARALAERGAHVLVNYFHSHEEALRTRAELVALGAQVDLIRASVARQDQVDRMFAEIEERFGHLDILVNSAANGALLPFDRITEADLDKALDTNYKGSLRCARAAAPLMACRGGGSIVQMSALGSSQMVMANYLACAPAKAAVEALTRYLAVEFAPLGIRVNTASAAMLVSEVADAFPDAEAMQEVIRDATPLGRLGTAEEFAALVAFLASDDSRWITGQTILADGGLSLGAALLSPSRGERSAPARDEHVPDDGDLDRNTVTEPAPDAHGTPAGGVDRGARGEVADDHGAVDEVADDHGAVDEVAIVGMGLAVAGANSPEEFWALRTTGAELFVPVPEDRWKRSTFHSADLSALDKAYQDTCVFITDFQPVAGAVETMDAADGADHELTTTWLRHSLVQALEGVRRAPSARHSFLVGYTPDGSQHLEEAGVLAGMDARARRTAGSLDLTAPQRERLLDAVQDTLTRRYRRGARAPERFLPHRVGQLAMAGVLPAETEVQMIDTACSSSLYAIDIGAKGLLSGKHDVAVCGGAFALAPRGTVLFSKLQGLSRRGAVHSLDADADGVIFADGAGVVVMKRLSDARRDGDRILGVLGSVGASSDGRGKAVYAPNAAGQDLAVRAAFSEGGSPADIDWIIAHATGTPAGDLAEFTTLRAHFGRTNPAYVTSNKSLIGHTGWAAGVVSVIEALLAMEHETIPKQFRFTRAPESFGMDDSLLEIPAENVPWAPSAGRPRTVAVSGFGFGGTNAHVLVREHREGKQRPSGQRPPDGRPARPAAVRGQDRVVVVGWAAHVPGLDREGVVEWIGGRGAGPADSFGPAYPTPPLHRVRLPPATVRTIDRCQLMILECAHDLRGRLARFWDAGTGATGVFVGHMGPTRAAMLSADRCYLDDVEQALTEDPVTASSPGLPQLLAGLRELVHDETPASNEDSFPGMMPNVISARVANYFDLKGPNITLDSGYASSLTAIETAARYLRSGQLDLALAGGINGNSLPEYATLLAGLPEGAIADGRLAEGAFMFALTTEATAVAAGLPVLGHLADLTVGATSSGGTPSGGRRIDLLPARAAAPSTARYLGAAGALAVLQGLLGPSGAVDITCRGQTARSTVHLTLGIPGGTAQAPPRPTATRPPYPPQRTAPGPQPAPRHSRAPLLPLPARFADADRLATGESPMTTRHVPVLSEAAAGPEPHEQVAFLPPGVVVLTDLPDLWASLRHLPADATVLCTAPVSVTRPGWHHLPEVTPEAVRAALADHGPVRHLRVVADLARSAPLPGPRTGPSASRDGLAPSLTALHDAAFLVLQTAHPDLAAEGSSFLTLLLGAVTDRIPHPCTGLFSGLVKCAALESPDTLTFLLATDERGPRRGALLAERESRAVRTFPVVLHADGRRLIPGLTPERALSGAGRGSIAGRLGPDSVVVAVGGARGITAEVVMALAEHFRPRIYLLGSNPLDGYPETVFEGDDETFAATRRSYIRENLVGGRTVAEVNRAFDRLLDARAARRTIRRLEGFCGADRVTYLTCDVRDEKAVGRAVDRVLAEQPAVDLLVNAAGRNRSALIKDKDFAEFKAVRDLKALAYRNLKRAFAGRTPATWCNFGSLLGHFGQLGEPDYAAGNDYLAAAAVDAAAHGADEFTVGWTLWDGVGMGAHELTKAYFERAGSYSHMPVREGVHHFLQELHAERRTASVVHIGVAERETIEGFYPGYLTRTAPVATAPHVTASGGSQPEGSGKGAFYLRETVSSDTDSAVFACAFDLSTDGYLAHHTVRGVPTLPGTFVVEIAAEAARHLAPDLRPVALEDLRFAHFLRVHGAARSAPVPKKITARVSERDDDLTVVEVSVTGDVRAPGGVLLVRDRVHFTARVLLRRELPAAPSWQHWDDGDDLPVVDPYHAPASPVSLTGPFVSTAQTRLHPLGKRSVYRAGIAADDPAFSRFTTPVILLDGMARTGVLHLEHGRLVPVAAPLSIRRVDLYEEANDIELTRRYGRLHLYVTPTGFDMTRDGPDNRFVAVTPEGRVVAQMQGVSATLVGRLDAVSGRLYLPDEQPLPGPTDTETQRRAG